MLGRRKPTRAKMIGQPKTQVIDTVVGEGGIYELELPSHASSKFLYHSSPDKDGETAAKLSQYLSRSCNEASTC